MKTRHAALLFCCLISISSFVYAKDDKGFSYRLIQENKHAIHVIDVDPDYYDIVLERAKPEKNLKTVSALAKHHKAKAAINGGYFAVRKEGETVPAGALKIKGTWHHSPAPMRAALGWQSSGKNVLIDRIDLDAQPDESWEALDNILGGVPLLIKNKQPVHDYSVEKARESFLYERHARTAVCIKENQHWLWVVVSHTKEADREHTKHIAEGFTIPELVDFLKRQECVQAINLDGGGSTTLVIDNHFANWPVGDRNQTSHLYQERQISDAILILPKRH